MIVAVDAGGTSIKATAVNPASLEMSEPITAPSDALGGPEDYLSAIARMIRGLASDRPSNAQAVGLSLPGYRDRRSGNWCGMPNVPAWPAVGLPLEARLRAALRAGAGSDAEREHWATAPIVFGNDADLAGLGEWRHRTRDLSAADAANFWQLHVTWGTGIGVGHVRNGEVQTGWEGGHIPVSADPAGPFCGCGRRNCLEAYAGVPRLIGRARLAVLGGAPTRLRLADLEGPNAARAITAAADAGDKIPAELLAEHAGWLAKGLAGLASIGTPDLITIGGGLADAGDVVMAPLLAAFPREDAGFIGRNIRIERSHLGNRAGYIGAAELARRRLS